MDETTVSAPEPEFREQVEQAEAQQAQEAEQPEQQEEQAQQEQETEQEQRERTVPLAALQEERAKARRFRDENAQYQQALAQMQQQQVAMMQALQRQQPPPPDPNTDPFAAQIHEAQMTRQEVAQMRQEFARRQQMESQQAAQQHFVNTVQSAEAAFTASTPDYNDAVNFLRERRVREYLALGFDQDEAVREVAAEGYKLAQLALSRGENPAVRAYELAKTIGYRRANGGAVPAQQKLEMQAQGQRAATPTGGAGAGGGKLSYDALAKMSPKEFLKATEGDKWRKLMGG